MKIQKNVLARERLHDLQPFLPLAEGVTLEEGVFIGPWVMFTNDTYPRAVNSDGSLQTEADWVVIPPTRQAPRVDRQQRHHFIWL